MQYRKYLIMILLCFSGYAGFAQGTDRLYAEADSVTWKLYQDSDWNGLIAEGKTYLSNHIAFKNLRLRVGYAAFLVGDYSLALAQYQAVLHDDSYQQTARYYAALCQTYLGRVQPAMYQINKLTAGKFQRDSLPSIAIKEISLESSYKKPGYDLRQAAYFERIGISFRIGWKVLVEQSYCYFNQQITPFAPPGTPNQDNLTTKQNEYFFKLNYMPGQNLLLWGAYHYLYSSLNTTGYQSFIGFAGLKYFSPHFCYQADANADYSSLPGQYLWQYNAGLTWLPTGNLNFYTYSRLSYKMSSNMVATQTIGGKIAPKLWMEGSASFGSLDNYMEADGLYIYNATDPSTFKVGSGLIYNLGAHTLLSLYYNYERKEDSNQSTNYSQHSITGGISWKF